MHFPKNATAKGSAAHGLSLMIAVGSLAIGLLVGTLQHALRHFRPTKRPEPVRGRAPTSGMQTLFQKP